MAHPAGSEHFLGLPPPPVSRREDLNFVKAAVSGLLHPGAQQRKVDDAITHHAAVGEQIGGGDQPVANMEREQAFVAGHTW